MLIDSEQPQLKNLIEKENGLVESAFETFFMDLKFFDLFNTLKAILESENQGSNFKQKRISNSIEEYSDSEVKLQSSNSQAIHSGPEIKEQNDEPNGKFSSQLQLIMETFKQEEELDESSLDHLSRNKSFMSIINDLIGSKRLDNHVLFRLVEYTKLPTSKKYEKLKSVFQMYEMMKDDDPEEQLDELVDSVKQLFA